MTDLAALVAARMQRAIADAQREHLAGRHYLPELVEAYRAGIIEWNRTQLRSGAG